MLPYTCHRIAALTSSATVSPSEAGVWNKIMINTANLKVKVSECQQTVNLLEKLKFNGLGTNQVEEFVRNDILFLCIFLEMINLVHRWHCTD